MDLSITEHHQIPLQKLSCPIKLRTIDRGPIETGQINFCTEPLHMQLSSLHHEYISFLITDCPKYSIILGEPWLHQHNPSISWTDREIDAWSSYCKQHCLAKPTLHLATT